MPETTTIAEDYAAKVFIAASAGEFTPVDFLKLTITPEQARKILRIAQWHSKNRLDADPTLDITSATLEVFVDFTVEGFDYCEEFSDDLSAERKRWGGFDFEAERLRMDCAMLRFDGAHISLRAIPKHINDHVCSTHGLADIFRAIAEGRAPIAARVSR